MHNKFCYFGVSPSKKKTRKQTRQTREGSLWLKGRVSHVSGNRKLEFNMMTSYKMKIDPWGIIFFSRVIREKKRYCVAITKIFSYPALRKLLLLLLQLNCSRNQKKFKFLHFVSSLIAEERKKF